ncbi:putative MFS transporter [Auricularia subglabra TFB-10046 SS5]|nr:putative MFS transporter [Auricularia subglabra TFB-10046 SS5]
MKGDTSPEISQVVDPGVQREPAIEQLEVEDAREPRNKLRTAAILMALYLSMFVAALDQTIVSTAIPTITAQLQDASGYTWIGSSYLLAKAAAMPLWAKLSDIWGRKPMILASMLVFFVSSIVCAMAKNMSTLLAGRALQGIGGGGLMQLVVITIADIFSLRQRSLFLGLLELMWAVAAGVGPTLGGVLAELVSWRWIFWLNLPIAGAAFVLIVLFLDVHDPRTPLVAGLRAVDWAGTVTMLGLTLMLLLGLNFGGVVAAWSSAKVVCLIVFGALMSVLFVFSERRLAEHPIMPPRLFRERSNVAAFAATAAQGFVFIALEYYLPLYLQAAQGASPSRSGLLVLPLVVTEALAAAGTGVLIHRTGEYRQALQAGMLVMTGGTALFVLLGARTPLGTVVGLQALAGAGVGLCFQPPEMAVQALVPQADVAAALATLGFVRNLATSLSIVAGGAVFQNGVARRQGALRAAGLDPALAARLTGPEAAANVGLIAVITDAGQRRAVEDAFAWGLRNMWILYACVGACGTLATLFIKRGVLTAEHTETKTGLRKKEEVERIVQN